jgi:hypothetical protein
MKQPRGKRVSIDRENGWLYALQPLDQTRLRTPKLQCKSEQPRWDRPDIDCEPQQAWGIPRNLQLDETVLPRGLMVISHVDDVRGLAFGVVGGFATGGPAGR